jgi:hypothetical protein
MSSSEVRYHAVEAPSNLADHRLAPSAEIIRIDGQ